MPAGSGRILYRPGPVGSGEMGVGPAQGRSQGSPLPCGLMPQKVVTCVKWGGGTMVPILWRGALSFREPMTCPGHRGERAGEGGDRGRSLPPCSEHPKK